jgi:hypothetical protein
MASRAGANINLELDMTPLLRAAPILNKKLDTAIAGIMEQRDSVIEAWMKSNAPWTDRTGAARSGLSARAFHEPFKVHGIDLFYRVPYGIWLEVRHSGKYAVIIPAIITQAPKIMSTLNKLFARLGQTGGA